MKPDTLERACIIDATYFGNIPLARSIEIIKSQTEALVAQPGNLTNIRSQAGDLLFAIVSLARNQGWELDSLLVDTITKIDERRSSRHYYEAHITIEPVFDDREGLLREVCQFYQFHVATLLLQKRKADTPERSATDSFATGRGTRYTDIEMRMLSLVKHLREEGFQVWRYKIESILLDSRFDDSKFPLDREQLPTKERDPRAPADGA